MSFHFAATFMRQSRSMFLTCTVVPVALGGALAWQETGVFAWGMFLLTLIGVSADPDGAILLSE